MVVGGCKDAACRSHAIDPTRFCSARATLAGGVRTGRLVHRTDTLDALYLQGRDLQGCGIGVCGDWKDVEQLKRMQCLFCGWLMPLLDFVQYSVTKGAK